MSVAGECNLKDLLKKSRAGLDKVKTSHETCSLLNKQMRAIEGFDSSLTTEFHSVENP